MENRSDLVDHLYIMILDVKDFDLKTRLLIRCTKVMNVYDQVIGRGYIYLKVYTRRKRAIEDIS